MPRTHGATFIHFPGALIRILIILTLWTSHGDAAYIIDGNISPAPRREMTEAEREEYRLKCNAHAAQRKRVMAGDPEAIRQELDRIWNNQKGSWLDSEGIPLSLLHTVIPLIRNGGKEAPPLESGECVVYGSPQERGFYIFQNAIESEKAFPAETFIWNRKLRMGDKSDESIAQILEWWEHNKEAVMTGRYAEAKWLHRSYALELDEHRARQPEREKAMERAECIVNGLPYAHLDAQLIELERTRGQRTKRLTELRLQQEKEAARGIDEQKERELRRKKPLHSSPVHEEQRPSTSEIIRWSPVAVIPMLGALYLLLRKRFHVS